MMLLHWIVDIISVFFFDPITGIWWHCDNDETTEISNFLEGIYTKDSHKNNINKKIISVQEKVLLMVCIRKRNFIESISVYNK